MRLLGDLHLCFGRTGQCIAVATVGGGDGQFARFGLFRNLDLDGRNAVFQRCGFRSLADLDRHLAGGRK